MGTEWGSNKTKNERNCSTLETGDGALMAREEKR